MIINDTNPKQTKFPSTSIIYVCVFETVDNQTTNEMTKQLLPVSENYDEEHFHNGVKIYIGSRGSERSHLEMSFICHVHE